MIRYLIIIAGLAIAFGIALYRFEMHKSSMEKIVGHPVSNWDAFWTQ